MPELPEVEILKNELNAHVLGRQVHQVVVPAGREGDCPLQEWTSAIQGASIVDVARRGKMLLLEFDSGFSLVIHLMMVGQLLLSSLYDREPNDVRLILDFGADQLSVGQVALRFLRLVPTSQLDELPEIKKLGCDPLSDDFSVEALRSVSSGRRGKVKSFLLNQRHIAGIGNTYADEILFHAGIDPARQVGSLTSEEVERLHRSIVEIMRRGLRLGGSSEMAFVHLDGTKGAFQEQFQVKQRKGKPCHACNTPIEKIPIGGRGTYFCPRCQR
ncbi:MAG: bifunctional DNA-formamidopyrimidine glycosylase/DNA-(apurinic or apyrimidinic site) lyase [Anaerolineae bacterium]|nr:bifunctional DNA-formamidopyrimidine glycosylase/DNA-(apurinic or apyrimidinic site) lyase [Anaerolineae bacterium]NIN95140.1 bifunctional DNA-formamidopyrimidine glycosylase/DNA-(apurinic or apyrimidinic site) lyase [Anaerolineae bacterium]NIQ78992.1 bifunctional DNA-formamidopyrimidine glycosylase/DNA-(apurinic or apyrimidinic site) lyase [Anaerolineae bacterium]